MTLESSQLQQELASTHTLTPYNLAFKTCLKNLSAVDTMFLTGIIVIFILVVIALYKTFNHQPEDGCKVQVELFYESLCPDSRGFIQGQLYDVWEDLSDIMEIHWKPYGFAQVK